MRRTIEVSSSRATNQKRRTLSSTVPIPLDTDAWDLTVRVKLGLDLSSFLRPPPVIRLSPCLRVE